MTERPPSEPGGATSASLTFGDGRGTAEHTMARARKFAPEHRPALAHFAVKMESSTDKSPQHIWNVFVVHGTREKSARVCLSFGGASKPGGSLACQNFAELRRPTSNCLRPHE